jgi:hypothetical protein
MTWPSAVATTTLPLATAGEDVRGEYLRPLDASNENLVDQNTARWNQVADWLKQLDGLRVAA